MSALLALLALLIQYYVCSGSNHNCNSQYGCYNQDINCQDNEDCTIQCTGSHACDKARFHCPINGNCILQCSNDYSCASATINGQSNTVLNVTCSAASSCRESNFNGGSNQWVNIICGKSYACYKNVFDFRSAAQLRLLDCATDTYTCTGVTVYCPPNIGGNKKCFIQGDNSLGSANTESVAFYAINSWNDIDFETPLKTDYYEGTMYCTTGYSSNCNIASSGWRCGDNNDLCQNPPTSSPTALPTTSPSNFPSKTPTTFPTYTPSKSPTKTPTSIPTLSPTQIPTRNPTNNHITMPSQSPTKLPTAIPSLFPTQIPTKNPTNNPIKNPSKTPTKAPSSIPTLTPTQIPTNNPSKIPTKSPSINPTKSPTSNPSNSPSTMNPSIAPSIQPSEYPTNSPTTSNPSRDPTKSPTPLPTDGVNLIIPNHKLITTTNEKEKELNVLETTTTALTTIENNINTMEEHKSVQEIVSNHQYAPYIAIGVILVIVAICCECIYCCCCKKRRRQKQNGSKTDQQISIKMTPKTKALQMIPVSLKKLTPNSILPAPPPKTDQPPTISLLPKDTDGHFKQTASHSVLSVSDIWQTTPENVIRCNEQNRNEHYKQAASNSVFNMNEIWRQTSPKSDDMIIMQQFGVSNAKNDTQIIGDDEYDDNAIITKQATFEDAENDQEIMSEKDRMITKTKGKLSEGDRYKHKKLSLMDENEDETIGDIEDDDHFGIDPVNIITPFGILNDEDNDEEMNNDEEFNEEDMITMDEPDIFGNVDEIYTIQ